MRKLKQLASVLLALVMCFGLTVTAFADEPATYSITVTNPDSGYTYTAYQIFTDAEYDGSSSFKANAWGASITTDEEQLKAMYAELEAIEDGETEPFAGIESGSGTVPIETAMVLEGYNDDDEVVQAFAAVVSKYITGGGTTSTQSSTKNSAGNYEYTFELAAGYYLVETTGLPKTGYDSGEGGAYTRYILAAVNEETKNTSSASKSDVPTIDKDLSDKDANIATDTITYYLTATLPTKYDDYETYKLVFHDTLSKGLTFDDNSVKVYVFTDGEYAYDRDLTDGTLVRTDGYTVSKLTEESDGGHSFTVTLTDTKKLMDDDGNTISTSSKTRIVVTFTAKLNSDAVIGGDGNPNEVYLEYSNNPNDSGTGNNNTGTTPEDKVVTWTYELDVTKVDSADNTEKLEGAEFKLYRLNSSNEKEYVVLADGKVTGWTTDEDGASTLTSDEDGLFSVIGLDVGTYYLTEVKAPDDYKTIMDDIELVIAATYSGTDSKTPTDDDIKLKTLTITTGTSSVANGTVSTTVANSKAGTLPSTGGIGTTIFYVVGGVLVVGAVVLLITRKRMQDDQ